MMESFTIKCVLINHIHLYIIFKKLIKYKTHPTKLYNMVFYNDYKKQAIVFLWGMCWSSFYFAVLLFLTLFVFAMFLMFPMLAVMVVCPYFIASSGFSNFYAKFHFYRIFNNFAIFINTVFTLHFQHASNAYLI